MKIKKIHITNFRLLKNITIDLEDNISVIIGKNNCGKTSFLELLRKFITSARSDFKFDDFNVELQNTIKAKILDSQEVSEQEIIKGISLKLFIKYDASDNLTNIGNKVIMDLDPKNNTVVLGFEYSLKDFFKLKKDFQAYWDRKSSNDGKEKQEALLTFLKKNHTRYFNISRKSLYYNINTEEVDETRYTDLDDEKISLDKIINFKYIDAKRVVSNKNTDKNLSEKSADIFRQKETNDDDVVKELEEALIKTDKTLDIVYKDIFKDVVEDVADLAGMKKDESKLQMVSSLQNKDFLADNTTVMYQADNSENLLPESYNGLGYMNLISIIFDIYILMHKFKKNKDENASDINLLFIEEPEVHTHPQMQYIFIKNIKTLLEEYCKTDKGNINLQTVLTTHSSHIVSESEFDDIKYFKKVNDRIESKNLKQLESLYKIKETQDDANYRFLKKYLTLNSSEIFFADKVIFIEGSTERILLPAIMKKIDIESDTEVKLLSQNISIIEVGNYTHIFAPFLDFIGIKTLIITDIDTNKDNTDTTNWSLKKWYPSKDFNFFRTAPLQERVLLRENKNQILCVNQTEESGYHARSFEDAFCHINKEFIKKSSFSSITKIDDNDNAWDMAKKINKKTDFAVDILLKSEDNFSNWKIPAYIEKGLKWLGED